MQPRCPLCLSRFDPETRFRRFCTEHPPRGVAEDEIRWEPGDPDGFLRRIRCPEARCAGNGGIGIPGVFVSHVGCPQGVDPFLVPGRGLAPVSGAKAVHPKKGTLHAVGHWQMALHRRIDGALGPDRPAEAWFPAALLRSLFAEEVGSGERRCALVGLIGSQSVGKSILAMQALDPEGYGTDGHLPAFGRPRGDFIYCSPELPGATVVASTYLKTLYMRQLMDFNSAFLEWVQDTPVMPRNVKVAFFHPEDRDAPTTAPAAPRAGNGLGREVSALFEWARAFFGSGPEASSAPISAAFYDLAGESTASGGDDHVGKVSANVDVLALVISWEELSGTAATLGQAAARLADALEWKAARRRQGVRCALVVTKADLAAKTHPALFDVIRKGPRDEDRRLLRSCLTSLDPAGANATIRRLDAQLAGPDVDEVFFIWTAGLEEPAPRSHGLADFVSWCVLDRRPS